MKLRIALWMLALAGGQAAHAHAFLDHAEPKVGSVVAVAPTELRLWFSQAIESAFVTAEVTDASGKPVNAGRAEVDARDHTLLHLPLQKLPPGAYTATWRVVSVDTHPTTGRFSFTVSP